MSRLFAPLTSKHRREKQAKQRSLGNGSKDPSPITKSSSFPNDIKEEASINANPPYYHATINTRPTTPAPVTENTSVPVSHPLTPPQSPRAEPRPDTAPPIESSAPAGNIAPTEDVSAASNGSNSSCPAPPPVLEAIQQPLAVVKEAAAREPDLVVLDTSSELEHLSTEELRKQWEDQEIERFLRVFSRQVHEVRSPADLPPAEGKARARVPDLLVVNECDEIDTICSTTTLNDEDGEEWRFNTDAATVSSDKNLDSSFPPTGIEKMTRPPVVDITKITVPNVVDAVYKSVGAFMTMMTKGQWPGQTPAEYIAMEWLIPYLPPAHRKTYHFSLGTMQATSSRLFLCTYPLYTPLVQRMWLLATWSKPQRSFIYGSLFWVLWWYNMLAPALLTRTLYEVLRRRIFKYPTASELRSRLLAAGRADAVADALTIQLDAHTSSGLGLSGLRDVWRVWRIVIKGKKKKARAMVQKGVDLSPVQNEPRPKEEEIEDANFRRFALATMAEIADFHERLVNIARWRQPEATRRYVMILFFSIILMIFTPAQILAKGIYAILGIAFWFLPTVILALPLEHLSRIPAPFGDVPTDAEFAMEIIGQRFARGETVLPSSVRNRRKNRPGATAECSRPDASVTTIGSATAGQMSDPYVDAGTGEIVNGKEGQGENGSEEETRRKNGPREMVKKGMIWVEEGKRMMKGEKRAPPGYDEHPVVKIYPAQYRASMGMLTTTPTMILFTPALSSYVELKIPLQDLRSIKKTGQGMLIKYIVRADQMGNDIGEAMVEKRSVGIPTGEIGLAEGSNVAAPFMAGDSGEPMTKEERFRWIGGRDECFAQLVGLTPGRWVKM